MEEINPIKETKSIKEEIPLLSQKTSSKQGNDESMSDDKKSDEEVESTTEFDVHEKGIVLTLQNLIKLNRKTRKSKKITVDLSNTKYDVIKQICSESFNWNITYRSNGDWNIRWQDFYINEDDLRRMMPYQKINHFPGSYNLGKKNYLGKNLTKMRQKFPEDYDFCPRTWLLPYQYEDLRNFYEKNKVKKPVFIVKPEASCQGKGIYLVKKFSTLKQDQHMVVQEYIKHPLLIDGLKFDFRVYVLVKSVTPLKVFIYREGLARFATHKYQKPSKKNLKNMCMHLTNYAVNKHNPEFQFNLDANQDNVGHKRSFSSILKYLEDNGKDANAVFLQIKQIVNKTMCSVQPYLSHLYRSCQLKEENNEMCFEVFGFDVMLDEDLKAYLIEVNHTPSFTTDTPLDYHIKHSLISDTLILIDTRSKAKSTYLDSKKQMIVGKTNIKMTAEERETQQRRLDSYEYKHQNGYSKSLPASSDDQLCYDKYIQAAQSIHDEFTGTKKNTERLVTQQLASSASLQNNTNSKAKSEQETPTAPKTRNSNIIRRPVSGIPLNLQKKVKAAVGNNTQGEENNAFYKSANNTAGFLNSSFNQQNQQINGYQPQTNVSTNQGNSSSTSSIQTVSVLSQKSNTNHIIKNIRKISQRNGYKQAQNIADQSVLDINQHSGSSTNIYPNGLRQTQGYNMNNMSREENSLMMFDTKIDQFKGGFNQSNSVQNYNRPESGRQELSYKLDQLKRELQVAKEEATKCVNEQESLRILPLQQTRSDNNNIPNVKFGLHSSQRPQSSIISNQPFRSNINAMHTAAPPLPSAPNRPYIQSANKTLVVKVKDESNTNSNSNVVVRCIGNSFTNGNTIYIPSVNHSNNLAQNRNEFLSIQRAKIEPKLYSNAVPGILQNGNNNNHPNYLMPINTGSSRGINTASLHGYSGNQNIAGSNNNNNPYHNNVSPKTYQNITPSSQQFNTSSNNNTNNNNNNNQQQLNILQEMGNKQLNIIVENKEKQNYKSRGNSSISNCREYKNSQSISSNNNQQPSNNTNNIVNQNNNNQSNPNGQQQSQNLCQNLRSNSYGNLHSEKGFVLTVENAQTTTNVTNYAQRKGLPMRSFKFDDKISNLVKFNIEDELLS